MKSFARMALAGAALVLALGGVVAQEVKVGDKAPTFEGTDDAGKPWKSADHVGKKIIVVYFYPADFTGGCTKQACSFRDDFPKLTGKDVEVIGISGDSVKTHALFKKEHKLPFTLLADEDGSIAKKFGVPVKVGPAKAKVKIEGKDVEVERGATIQRWTFIIDKEGKITQKNDKVNAAEDSKNVLGAIK
jgi:thioredoxin-dependent peroxiredoxin